MLIGLKHPWDFEQRAWELRIGMYRVFYYVDEQQETVTIQAIRYKPPHKTTEEIL
jgi:mRNA-degrading endonuclease RelE of RelBE toxin-antitoxin system